MLMPLRRYAEFSGRSRRMEYWMWQLGKFLVSCVIFLLFFAMAGPALLTGDPKQLIAMGAGILFLWLTLMVFGLAIFVPDLAVTVRRLHDTERTGWWILAPLAPYVVILIAAGVAGSTINLTAKDPAASGTIAAVGIVAGLAGLAVLVLAIILLVFMFLEGTRGPNKYGPDPKADSGQVFS
jgi:uncharacterized membrane protein YhaH (DUF805 family)